MNQYIGAKELCKKLEIHANTLNNYRRKGLPYIGKGSGIRYNYFQVIEWLENLNDRKAEKQ